MTEKEKRFAIIGGTVLIAVLLLIFFRKNSTVIHNSSDASLPNVFGPQLGPVYTGAPTFFNIPGLNLDGPNLNMIGACCSDCTTGLKFDKPQAPTFVYNQASDPTIINYTYASPYVSEGLQASRNGVMVVTN